MTLKVVMVFEYFALPTRDVAAYESIGAEFSKIPCKTEDEIITAAQDADAILTIGIQPITKKVIKTLTRCRLISSLGIGYNGIDVEAATEQGICVCNVPDYCLEEMSDHTMALMLACARKLLRIDKAVREGKWDSLDQPEIRFKIWPPMFRLRGQILGLVGFGRVPRSLVPKAHGFGMNVIVYDPYVSPKLIKELKVKQVDFDSLLKESDFVSVHAALTPENHHMISTEQFKMMKPTSYLINTARGPLVDEEALYGALSEGQIAGAGLDVLADEPPNMNNPLFQLDNVIITGHSAHYSDESTIELRKRPEEELFRVFQGEWPRGLLNSAVKEKFIGRWGEMKSPV